MHFHSLCKKYIQHITHTKFNVYSTIYMDTTMNMEALVMSMKGRFCMISYEPLWSTMEKRKVTKYQLIYHWGISSNTLRRMGHGEPISSNTLNELCLILDCRVEDILKFVATEEEINATNQRKEEISNFRRKKHKK